ncbi:MAG TPA: cupin domain-containing protein [Polyangiaceae bacterium]
MKEKPASEPEFLRELELEAPDLASLSLERLPELLPEAEVPAGGRDRLLAEVSELPLRYAPFFEALRSLWDLSEDELRAELVRSKDDEEWRFTALPGIRLFDVNGGAKTQNQRVRLVRFAPGFRFPVHSHKGHERVLILEGSYTDSSGTVYRSGDLHEMKVGSEHGFVVDADEPCIAAVVEEGREFRSVFLRVLSKLVRDG